ncbi:MAG: hypothetical protein JWR40_2959 [Massilia sp.]|nr:hypothetical protein [Massilia sp.]
MYIDHQKGFIAALEELTAKLNVAPDDAAQEMWDRSSKYDKKELMGFDGPYDPKYREKLKREYAEGLEHTWAEIARLQKGRP